MNWGIFRRHSYLDRRRSTEKGCRSIDRGLCTDGKRERRSVRQAQAQSGGEFNYTNGRDFYSYFFLLLEVERKYTISKVFYGK